jgi:hypothetical protein
MTKKFYELKEAFLESAAMTENTSESFYDMMNILNGIEHLAHNNVESGAQDAKNIASLAHEFLTADGSDNAPAIIQSTANDIMSYAYAEMLEARRNNISKQLELKLK